MQENEEHIENLMVVDVVATHFVEHLLGFENEVDEVDNFESVVDQVQVADGVEGG